MCHLPDILMETETHQQIEVQGTPFNIPRV
nr:MAG TPA: hypothetical protein [Bacteriophage sp.]